MLTGLAAVLGALAGLLVPWPAYRLSVPYPQQVRVSCPDCDAMLPGWIRVPARCPGGHRVGPAPWPFPVLGALAFGGLGWAIGPRPELAAYLLVAALGLVLAAVDLAVLRLPDPLVGTAFLAATAVLAGAAVAGGGYGRLRRALLAGLVMALLYAVLAVLPGANLGFGDVKLSAVLGLTLGWLGWPAVLLGLVVPHLLNAPVVLALLLSDRARRGTSLPLGPALLAGWVLAVVLFVMLDGWLAR